MLLHQARRKFLQTLRVSLRESALNDDVLTLQIAEFRQLSHEGRDEKRVGACIEQPYSEALLRPRRERPRRGRTTE
jgi:hypothetical protein